MMHRVLLKKLSCWGRGLSQRGMVKTDAPKEAGECAGGCQASEADCCIVGKGIGNSMQPTIEDGASMVVDLVKPGKTFLRRGDLVVLKQPGGLQVHRFKWAARPTDFLEPHVILQGDNFARADSPQAMDRVLAKVIKLQHPKKGWVRETRLRREWMWLRLYLNPVWIPLKTRLAKLRDGS